jgi:aminoacrylate hydrolase
MPTLDTQGISLHYELHGDRRNPPVMLISGLGGTSSSWDSQTARFARDHFVIVPDHRGTGRTTHAADGYTIAQHAADMASLLAHLDVGATHLIGSSTGGAIAQLMALDHPAVVRSVVMTSSFARTDPYTRREFWLRRKLLTEADPRTIYGCYALFLFSPAYAHAHPDVVEKWIARVASLPLSAADREIALKRTDMILAHDALARLGAMKQPVLIVCGDHDLCTPPFLSEEMTRAIPGSELVIIRGGGHFIHDEQPDRYFDIVRDFVGRY